MGLKPLKKKNSTTSTPSGGNAPLVRATSTVSSAVLKNQPIQDRCIEMIKSGYIEGITALLAENQKDQSFLNLYHSKGGKHPLAVAAEEGRLEMVEEFLKCKDLIIDLLDSDGMTAVLYAAQNGEIQILDSLYKQGADLSILTPKKESVLYIAVSRNKLDMVKYLIDRELPIETASIRNETPLSVAIKYEYYEIAEALLAQGANINIRRTNGDTPLFAAVFDNRIQTVNFILDHGGGVNCINDDRETPLMIASRYGFEAVATVLLDRGAEINDADNGGRTPLHHAIMTQQVPIVQLLVQRDADVNRKDLWGYTPFALACSLKTIKFEIIHLLMSVQCEINCNDRCANTPLILASKNQNSVLVRFLIEQGADCSLKNIDEKAAIDYFPSFFNSSTSNELIDLNASNEGK